MSEPAQDEFFDALLSDFLDESSQLLDRLNDDLLTLDEWASQLDGNESARCDEELMNSMFRSAHSIKGLSGMLGLSRVNQLTHRVENVFDAARKDELTLRYDVVEIIFQAMDRLAVMLDSLREQQTDEVDCAEVMDKIQKILESSGAAREAQSQEDAEKTLGELEAALANQNTGGGDPVDAASEQTPDTGQAPGETAMSEAPVQTAAPASPEPPESNGLTDEQQQHLKKIADAFEGLEDEGGVPTKYLSIFIDETELALDALSEALLQEDDDASEQALITSHRIKGSAASIGLHRPAKLAHFMEDLLQECRETKRTLSCELTDAVLPCVDELRAYVGGLKSGGAGPDNFATLAVELEAARFADKSQQNAGSNGSSPEPVQSAPAQENSGESMEQRFQRLATRAPAAMLGYVAFEPDLPLAGLKAELIIEKVHQCGEIVFTEPSADALEGVDELDGVSFGVITTQKPEEVTTRLSVAGVREVTLDDRQVKESSEEAAKDTAPAPAATPESKSQPTPAATPAANGKQESTPASGRRSDSTSRPTETLRVDIERLDQLMNLAGQLVINKARFSQVGEALRNNLPNKQAPHTLRESARLAGKLVTDLSQTEGTSMDMESVRNQVSRLEADLLTLTRDLENMGKMRNGLNELFETVHQLDRVTDGIQKSVMETRMVPIGPLFSRFKRVIRDLTRTNGKSIRLEIGGEKTELDKRMIDELGDPLIHMVRNSADHGIEQPDEREAAGKPRQGVVRLDACHRGNSIVISIVDDGKGLDPDKILKKAIERELVTAADAERLTNSQIYQLIWEPGFSTAEKVTEISGRGMGMDIVRSKIEDISGSVEVDSTPGEGTTFTIRLPLTLAILPSLLAEIDGEVFALPVESIEEIFRLQGEGLSTVQGQRTALIRGRVVSVVELDQIFSWNVPPRCSMERSNDDCTLVMVGEGHREVGLRVDRLLGEEDVVIKSLAENYQNVAGISGASILGDGRVCLILDPAALIEMSSSSVAGPV